jgi:integrase
MLDYKIYQHREGLRAKVVVGVANKRKLYKYVYGQNNEEIIQGVMNLEFSDVRNKDLAKMNLAEFIEYWLFEVKYDEVNKSTTERYESILRIHIVGSRIGILPLRAIKPSTIQSWYSELTSLSTPPSTIKNIQKVLHLALEYAVSIGLLSSNPSQRISLPKATNKSLKQGYSLAELGSMFKSCRYYKNGFLIPLAFFTGLREGELLELRWENIDFGSRMVKIEKSVKLVKDIKTAKRESLIQPTKNENSQRYMKFNKKSIQILQEHQEDKGLVFHTASNKHINPNNVRMLTKRICKKANVEYRRFHSLRGSYATHLYNLSTPMRNISELLGHSSIKITEDYIYRNLKLPNRDNDIYSDKLSDLF